MSLGVATCRLPRVRGDRPSASSPAHSGHSSPPRTRGSTLFPPWPERPQPVSPAYAGIDRRKERPEAIKLGLPRVRGDRPHSDQSLGRLRPSPPRTRGSTFRLHGAALRRPVSPAYAGIDRPSVTTSIGRLGLPRVRGDRPALALADLLYRGSPPRTRGSTGIMRGSTHQRAVSPRTRGSTEKREGRAKLAAVSPAHAGIDLRARVGELRLTGLPRARGDRPSASLSFPISARSPPRSRGSTWRGFQCFGQGKSPPRSRGPTWDLLSHVTETTVSPALAGIDPRPGPPEDHRLCLPRTRGDRPKPDAPSSSAFTSPPRLRGSTCRRGSDRTRVCQAILGVIRSALPLRVRVMDRAMW